MRKAESRLEDNKDDVMHKDSALKTISPRQIPDVETTEAKQKEEQSLIVNPTTGSSPGASVTSALSTEAVAAETEQIKIKKILDEIHSSEIVSEKEKLAVEKFFRDKGTNDLTVKYLLIFLMLSVLTESQSSDGKEGIPSSDVSPVITTVKLKENEVVDKNGEKKIVRILLELKVHGTNYTYRKLQRTARRKNENNIAQEGSKLL